jgi:streptogramin lyase
MSVSMSVRTRGSVLLRSTAAALLMFLAFVARGQVAVEFSAGIAPGANPTYIAAGPDGNLWFTEFSGNAIGRITLAGVVTEFTVGMSANARATGITAGPDGNIWFAEQNGNRIGKIVALPANGTVGTISEFDVGSGAGPYAITTGPDGNLWFTENLGNRIGRITPQGVVTHFSAGISAGAFPLGIAAGPDGNLWFTEEQGDRIGQIIALPGNGVVGTITEFGTGITAGSRPYGITAGPDNNLWFVEHDGSRVGRIIVLPANGVVGTITEFSAGITAASQPYAIVAGSDGNLWFTVGAVDQIGRITPAGTVTEFGGGITAGTFPLGIAAGPDGNLWFTEFSGNAIGRITTLPVAAPTLQSAVSRKVHGSAGTFDLPLSLVDVHNPTTEPRQGPAQTIVFTFDKPIAGATAAVTESAAVAGTPTFAGNDVIVPLTNVANQQYVTIVLTNVLSVDGGSGGSGSARIGFLIGDVNGSRVVTVADLGLVNAQLSQVVTAANYLKDVNASGTLTLADKGITNAHLTQNLPTP